MKIRLKTYLLSILMLSPSSWASSHDYIGANVNGADALSRCYFPLFKVSYFDCKGSYPVKATLAFQGVDSAGVNLVTEFKFDAEPFTKILPSQKNELRIRGAWQLYSCDQVRMAMVADTADLASVIASFRDYDFKNYMSCTFLPANQFAFSENISQLYFLDHPSLDILDSGDVMVTTRLIDQSSPNMVTYYRWSGQVLPASEQAVDQSAQDFVAIVKNYGNLLVALREAAPADRTTSLNAFLSQNKAALVRDLDTIDRELESTGALTKMNVTFTIRRGYAYVRALEAKIQSGYVFDQVVVRP